MRVAIEIAPGELLDKITILEIKRQDLSDQNKLRHVKTELELLNRSLSTISHLNPEKIQELADHKEDLRNINQQIWDVLQRQRDLENAEDFGPDFVAVSLEVYHKNDERAEIKRKINQLLDTDIAEVKSYK